MQNSDLKILVSDIPNIKYCTSEEASCFINFLNFTSYLLSANMMCWCRLSCIVPINTGTEITETLVQYRKIQYAIS